MVELMRPKKPAQSQQRLKGLITGTILLAIVWSAFAFGAVYAWAYVPLLFMSVIIVILTIAIRTSKQINRPVVLGLAVISLAVMLQLVPMSQERLSALTPAAGPLVQQYDLAFSASGPAATPAHGMSIDPPKTRLGLAFLVCFGLCFAALTRTFRSDDLITLANGLSVVGAALALVAIIQKPLFNGKIYGFWTPLMGTSAFGPFVNRNHFAGWMLMATPLCLGYLRGVIGRDMRLARASWHARLLWFSTPEANRVLLLAFATFVMGFATILTLSRSGIICFLFSLLLAGWIGSSEQSGGSKGSIYFRYLLILTMLALAWIGIDKVVEPFGDPAAADFSGRLPIWQDTLRIIRDFPWTGTGLNTYGTATLFYQTTIRSMHLAEAHSDYLQLGAEGGILLGIPILGTIVVFVREVRRRFRERRDDWVAYCIRTGAVVGLTAMALQELGEFSLQIPANAVLFVVLAAIAVHQGDGHFEPLGQRGSTLDGPALALHTASR